MNEYFLDLIYSLAKKGAGLVSPNPLVGACLVRDNKVLSKGWHKKYGDNHAERDAILNFKKKYPKDNFEDLILYSSLEPCDHVGATPSCTELILQTGIKKVFIACLDPLRNGMEKLRENGVTVELLDQTHPMYLKFRLLNQPFLKSSQELIPYVTLKAGMSLDGKIATHTGVSQWITSSESRFDALNERSMCDAVLVGSGTVISDNPNLNPNNDFKKESFYKIIIDKRLQINTDFNVFKKHKVLIATTDLAPQDKLNKFESLGIKVQSFGRERVDINNLLKYLYTKNIRSVFVEGGSATHGSFFDSEAFDRIIFYISPKLIGGKKSLPVIGGKGLDDLSTIKNLTEFKCDFLGEDLKCEGYVNIY